MGKVEQSAGELIEASMESFDPTAHLVNIFVQPWLRLHDEGIRGREGAIAQMRLGDEEHEIGVDFISMEPGSQFPLHVHAGAHILYFAHGVGMVDIDGVDHRVVEGDSIYIPAMYPHGVKTYNHADDAVKFLAFGIPHMPVESKDRMWRVKE